MIRFLYIKIMQKSKTRLFIKNKLSIKMVVCIKEKQHHFIKNVLRGKNGDEILLLDNQTGEWCSHIISINRDNTVLQVFKKNKELIQESDIWLAFAPIKQHRINITIQKVTELGISKIIPCLTNYTNNHFINYKNLELNIVEAAEQCERLTLPKLEKQMTLEELLLNQPKNRALIFCNENSNSGSSIYSILNKIKNKFSKWTILIGPEGGFSPKEIEMILKCENNYSVFLGPRILRSDTAATAALFCLQSILENNY